MARNKISVNVSNLLKKNLNKAPESYKKAVRTALAKSALAIHKEAVLNVPVDTGRLKSSIGIDYNKQVPDEGESPSEAVGKSNNYVENGDSYTIVIGTNVEYSAFIEFGTSRQTARPFLFPAYEGERGKLEGRIEKELNKVSKNDFK